MPPGKVVEPTRLPKCDSSRHIERTSQADNESYGMQASMSFGASGPLKNRILAVESSHVFASANMAHPDAMVAAGKAPAATAFASNALCGTAVHAFDLRNKTLLQQLLDADARVRTSRPKATPSGGCSARCIETTANL
jgi:molybdate transport system substrate-binding protein